MPIIAAVYLFCYFSKNHICSRLILSFSTKIFLNIQWGNSISMRIDATPYQVPFNITMPGYLWSNATINSGDIPDIVIVPYIQNANANGLQILIDYETGHTYVPGTSVTNVLWIAIGYAIN